ncbi:uncharacterized protein PAC_10872 [Phialocephala subalpina]|uniref:Uncharacterized protein n=1 Tax=Phialocephala subalpina TaxID=576137 RepID=A0A1L7X7I7_9HELO|nr:uncharacterized protein PAC_10872 [Phialocephala subalpina]
MKRGDQCSGYEPIYVWVKGYQKYPPGRRRVLRSDLTWHGYTIHQSPEIDAFITQCDVESHDETEAVEKAAGPFTVFCTPVGYPRVPPSISDTPNSTRSDVRIIKELCHHYFTYTALNMMPFKDKRNPWMSFYPRLARQGSSRGQRALYNAMLAQAAGNLAQLGSQRDKMSALAIKFYADGIKDLRKGLESKEMDFSTVVASIMTLIMAEIYAGISNVWRMHLDGAWNFLVTHKHEKPWEASEEAWTIAQSLIIVKIRVDTMGVPSLNSTQLNEAISPFIAAVVCRHEFGFTAGADGILMNHLHDVNMLESRLRHGDGKVQQYREDVAGLYQRIQSYGLEASSSNQLVRLHHEIFRTGVLVHFHRRILNSLPHTLVPLLDNLLSSVEEYERLKGGYVTLWPVFIGAAEVFEEHQKLRVRAWLDTVDLMGAANRRDVRTVIEAVWNERSCQRNLLGRRVAEGEVIVDWREVMRDMGVEILLV